MQCQTVLFVPDEARLETVPVAHCLLAPASDLTQPHQTAQSPQV